MAHVHVRHNPPIGDTIALDVRIEITGMELEASDPAAVLAVVAREVGNALERERTRSRGKTVTK